MNKINSNSMHVFQDFYRHIQDAKSFIVKEDSKIKWSAESKNRLSLKNICKLADSILEDASLQKKYKHLNFKAIALSLSHIANQIENKKRGLGVIWYYIQLGPIYVRMARRLCHEFEAVATHLQKVEEKASVLNQSPKPKVKLRKEAEPKEETPQVEPIKPRVEEPKRGLIAEPQPKPEVALVEKAPLGSIKGNIDKYTSFLLEPLLALVDGKSIHKLIQEHMIINDLFKLKYMEAVHYNKMGTWISAYNRNLALQERLQHRPVQATEIEKETTFSMGLTKGMGNVAFHLKYLDQMIRQDGRFFVDRLATSISEMKTAIMQYVGVEDTERKLFIPNLVEALKVGKTIGLTKENISQTIIKLRAQGNVSEATILKNFENLNVNNSILWNALEALASDSELNVSQNGQIHRLAQSMLANRLEQKMEQALLNYLNKNNGILPKCFLIPFNHPLHTMLFIIESKDVGTPPQKQFYVSLVDSLNSPDDYNVRDAFKGIENALQKYFAIPEDRLETRILFAKNNYTQNNDGCCGVHVQMNVDAVKRVIIDNKSVFDLLRPDSGWPVLFQVQTEAKVYFPVRDTARDLTPYFQSLQKLAIQAIDAMKEKLLGRPLHKQHLEELDIGWENRISQATAV